jgi:hypothetical protein
MSDERPLLDIASLDAGYGDLQILTDVDMVVGDGEFVTIVGPNGAGKSTLIKSVLELVPRTAGHVYLFGKPYQTQRKRVAYVPQRSAVDWDFPTTALDVVMMGRYGHLGWLRRPGAEERRRAMAALEEVGMAELRHVVLNDNDDEGLEVDDTDSVLVTFCTFPGNEGEGLELDGTRGVVLVSVESIGNDGSGIQVNAETVVTERVTIIAGTFSGNGEDGLQFVEEEGTIGDVTLASVVARNNEESGLDLSISGALTQRRVVSENNGEPDQLP